MRVITASDEVIRPIISARVINNMTGASQIVLALLDSGSDRDVISTRLSTSLSLSTWTEQLTVTTLGNTSTGEKVLALYRLESVDSLYKADIEGALVGDLLTGSGDLHPSRRNLMKYSHLSSLDFGDDNGAELEMIIGVAHIDTWIAGDVRRGPSNQPMGIRTAFGWTIVGSQGRTNSTNITVSALSLDNDLLKEDLQRIFYHDFPLVTEEEYGNSQDNRKAVRLLEDSIHFCEDRGKFVVALPWKYGRQQSADILNSVDSKGMALRRLKSMIPKLKWDKNH